MTQPRRASARFRKTLAFMRSNALGLLALVVASSGTAFAATQLPDDSVDSDTIVFQGVGNEDLAEGAVSSGKIRTGAVRGRAVKESTLDPEVLQRRVGGQCRPGESIRAIGSDGSVLCQVDTTGATGAAGGDLTGSYPDPQLASDVVGSAELADDSVAGDNIVDRAIAAIDVALDSLTGAEVDESTLAAGGDLTGNLANAQVTESGLTAGGDLSGTLANAQIGAGTVGTPELAAVPNARAEATAQQSIGIGVPQRVALDTLRFSSGVTFDDATDEFVVQTPGVYQISGEVLFAPGTGTVGFIVIAGNAEVGTHSTTAVGNYGTYATVSGLARLTSGQRVSLSAFTDTATTTDLGPGSTGQSPYGAVLGLTLVSTTNPAARPAPAGPGHPARDGIADRE